MKRLEKKYVKAMRPNENKTVIDKTKEAVAGVRAKVLKESNFSVVLTVRQSCILYNELYQNWSRISE